MGLCGKHLGPESSLRIARNRWQPYPSNDSVSQAGEDVAVVLLFLIITWGQGPDLYGGKMSSYPKSHQQEEKGGEGGLSD